METMLLLHMSVMQPLDMLLLHMPILLGMLLLEATVESLLPVET